MHVLFRDERKHVKNKGSKAFAYMKLIQVKEDIYQTIAATLELKSECANFQSNEFSCKIC